MSNPFDTTGPPYPPPPTPDQIGIGIGAIGTMPIGDVELFQYRQTIISQYANSPIMDTWIDYINAWFDPTNRIVEFYDNIMNVDTAVGYGLDVWGRIVGVNRVVQIPTSTWFGFAQALPTSDVFGSQGGGSALWSGEPLTHNYYIADQEYRRMILAKAMYNITDGSIKSINHLMMEFFGTTPIVANFTGSIVPYIASPTSPATVDSQLFVTAVSNGTIPIGSAISGLGIPDGTQVEVQLEDYTGGLQPYTTGRYQLSPIGSTLKVGSEAMQGTYRIPRRGNDWVSEQPEIMHAYFGFWQADGLGPPVLPTIGPVGDSNIQGFNQAGFFNGQFVPSHMGITYNFAFQLSGVEMAIVTQSGILPRPAGVSSTVVVKY